MKQIIFFSVFILTLTSCTVVTNDVEFETLTIIESQETYNINSKKDLEQYITERVKSQKISIKEVVLEDYEHHTYKKIIKSKYIDENGDIVSHSIPLKNFAKSISNDGIEYAAGCDMKCKPKGSCCGCDQTVTEPCASQICSCNDACNVPGVTGSCNASVSF